MRVRPFLQRALARAEHHNTELQARLDEQRRLASDLHDDIGPALLALVQEGQRGDAARVAQLARQALQDMRLSVRGLTSPAGVAAADVLADWRAEAITALADAGLQAEWDAPEPPEDLVVSPRLHVQLTRILREAVGNAIRHSGARRCVVRLRFVAARLRLEVADDGRGLAAPALARSGHGLAQVERRARLLGGLHRIDAGPLGGLRLLVEVPLPKPRLAQEA